MHKPAVGSSPENGRVDTMSDERLHGGSLLSQVEGAEKLFHARRRSRKADLGSAVKIFLELLRACGSFNFTEPCVTVFVSARYDEKHEYYRLALYMGAALPMPATPS